MKIVMFDFDGVIADSWCGQKRAFADALKASGLDEYATSAIFRDLLEVNWFEALPAAGMPDEAVAAIETAFLDVPCPDLFAGMPEVIGRLAERYPVLIISSSATSDVTHVLEEHDVRGIGEVLGGDVDTSKVRKIRNVRRRFGEEHEAWYVGDTVGDVIEAREAGAATIGAAWGWHGEERLLSAAPDHIARHPHELLDLLLDGSEAGGRDVACRIERQDGARVREAGG